MTRLLEEGQRAPAFTARGSDGRTYRLADLLADGSRVLLVFYPGNDTPG